MPRTLRALSTLAAALLLGFVAHSAPAQPAAKPAADDGPYRVGGGVSRPEIVSQGTKPAYTEEARKARITGVVIVEAVIDEKGDVTNTRVLKGLPMGLDQSAVDAVKTWKFKPALFKGEPVKVYYILTVNFQVDGAPYQGPLFLRFRREHPNYSELVNNRKFVEAAAFLDGLPADQPQVALARIYLLLDQDLLSEGLQAARGLEADLRDEALQAVGSYALSVAWRNPGTTIGAEAVETGLTAADAAIETSAELYDAMALKSALLKTKADQTTDLEESQRLRKQSQALAAQAIEMKRRLADDAESFGGDEPLRVAGDVTPPEKISGDLPTPTELATRARVSGNVIVRAVIDEEGDVLDVRIVKGLPMGLDLQALEAVRTWKFKPATRNGQPVKVYYNVTVNFPEPKVKE